MTESTPYYMYVYMYGGHGCPGALGTLGKGHHVLCEGNLTANAAGRAILMPVYLCKGSCHE